MMRPVRWALLFAAFLTIAAGCSTDITEISDVALVMITGVDYDEERGKFIFTAYCILPSATSTEKTDKHHEWVASAQGDSILDAARNLRSRAGKTMNWQHDKFFVIGEEAARHAFYEIVDYMTRSRDIRLTSYILVSEGKALDTLKNKSETNDLLANDLLGRTINQHLWGKSISLTLKDISNWFADPYRGFVTGRLRTNHGAGRSEAGLVLSGGSAFHKGKFIGWLNGQDTLTVYMLSKRKEWNKLEFALRVQSRSANVTLLMHAPKKKFHFRQSDQGPAMDVDMNLKATLMDMDRPLQIQSPETLEQLERAAGREIEEMIEGSLRRFQRDFKADLLGLSDFIRQYHSKEWSRMKDKWDELYPAMPVKIHANVKLTIIGMNQSLEGN
ncbi:Ger(x)C family spore germination protein [Cohnella zeiphila]|uniref:Ger(X)C family spore germination protein n=1 Tax=Cohnella zeiphila TaxID=2761120 RepID=A0A7X0VXN6_9BACL|nr:Ger(x)C family spore germination protein [Cohnella zeiphila]MBB6734196.1 Ger(x)C family spore germination protein [Cohnella zeiphila]